MVTPCISLPTQEAVGYGPECHLKMPQAGDGCGGMWRTQQSSRDGEEEGQWEMVASSSGMPHPHPAVRDTAMRQFIAASCVPQAGGGESSE